MKRISNLVISLVFVCFLSLQACQKMPPSTAAGKQTILAAEPFLADIAQNVAGDRLKVEALLPPGMDPHSFEATPQDMVALEQTPLLILNGCGLEEWMQNLMEGFLQGKEVIEACAGLQARTPDAEEGHSDEHEHESDPHFWLDPNNVIQYVENIRDGLVAFDPQGKDEYQRNAAQYITSLQDLDRRIRAMVAEIPPEKRLLVTNHESLGYFADRYGFKVVGAIIPSVSSGSTPTAQELSQLADAMRELQVNAIFLEVGANSQLARQIASETGIQVVSELYSHSLSGADGPAATYLMMMEYNTRVIVDALK